MRARTLGRGDKFAGRAVLYCRAVRRRAGRTRQRHAGEPANVGDLKNTALARGPTRTSPKSRLRRNVIGNKVPTTPRAAIVFDIDETAAVQLGSYQGQ